MKKIILFCLLGICIQLSAQDVIWLSPTEYDFGEFEQFDIQQVVFKFKNNTDGPIVVENVRATCGCTSPDWSEEPIPADSISQITIEYDARKLGYFYKKIKVYFKEVKKGSKLIVEGEVIEKT